MILLLFLCCNIGVDLEHLYDLATTRLVSFRTVKDSAMQEFVSLASDSQTQETTVVFLLSKFDTKSAVERHTLKDIFKLIGESAIPLIVNELDYRGSDAESRSLKQSLWVLGEIGTAQIVEPVALYIHDEQWSVRSGAYTALGKSRSVAAIDYVLEGVDDSVTLVRKSAYHALSELATEQQLPHLLRGLSDPFYGVRYAALSGVRRLKLQEEMPKTLVDDEIGQFFTIAAMDSNEVWHVFNERFESVSPPARKVMYGMLGAPQLEQALRNETHPLLKSYLKQRIRE
ncbi:MAG: HEAT repeat domain-containing protein [candidate division WOR-3 bacterium]